MNVHIYLAEITLLTSSEGGKTRAITSGYRPQVSFHGDQTYSEVRLVGRTALSPGATGRVELRILMPEYLRERLEKGDQFEVFEGPLRVGTGKIVEVIEQ